jgi:hypothetical protein
MESLDVFLANKAQIEVNLAKIDAELDLKSEVQCQELEPIVVQPPDEGPVPTRSYLTRRKATKEVERREFWLSENKAGRRRFWRGCNDYTGNYAVVFYDQGSLRLVLTDSIFKFSRVINGNASQPCLMTSQTMFSEDSDLESTATLFSEELGLESTDSPDSLVNLA